MLLTGLVIHQVRFLQIIFDKFRGNLLALRRASFQCIKGHACVAIGQIGQKHHSFFVHRDLAVAEPEFFVFQGVLDDFYDVYRFELFQNKDA